MYQKANSKKPDMANVDRIQVVSPFSAAEEKRNIR